MLVGNVQLVRGNKDSIPVVLQFLSREGISVKKNRDLYTHHYPHFGAEEARALRLRSTMRAVGDRRVFVIAADVMTLEAQNTLLKTLEEPAGEALFVLIVPAPSAL